MPEVYATARGPLARLAAPLAARARARRHERFFALTRLPPAARVLDVGCGALGLRALEPELDITGVDLARAARLPGAVRAGRRRRGPAVRRRRVRPRVLLERDRARPPRPPRGVRRGAAPRGARLVRADAGPLVPDRAPLAAAGRPLAARRAAPPLLAPGRGRRAGRRSRCCAARELEALFGPARPGALRGARQELGACGSARQAADVVADAVDHQEQQQRRSPPS